MNIEEIVKQLQPLAEKLQSTGQQLFEWAIRQNYYVSFVDFMVGLIFLIMAWLIYSKYRTPRKDEISLDGNDGIEIYMLAAILALIGMVIIFYAGDRLVNPEMNALMDLINHLN